MQPALTNYLPLLCARAGDAERDILSALNALVRDCTQMHAEQRPSMKIVLERVRHVQKMYDDLRLAAEAASSAATSSSAPSPDSLV